MLKRVFRHLDLIAGCMYLTILTGTTCYSVVSRFFFNKPLMWFEAYAKYILMALVLVTAPYVARKDGHICMREFLFKMPVALQKVIFILTDILCIGFYSVIAYSAIIMIRKNMTSVMIGFSQPYWWFYAPVVVGFILLAMMYLYILVDHILHGIPKPVEVEVYDLDSHSVKDGEED